MTDFVFSSFFSVLSFGRYLPRKPAGIPEDEPSYLMGYFVVETRSLRIVTDESHDRSSAITRILVHAAIVKTRSRCRVAVKPSDKYEMVYYKIHKLLYFIITVV